MDTETTNIIAVISLVLVILVILYLFLGRLIGNMYPNSKANKFFGGTTPTTERDIIINKLLNIHDEDDDLRTIYLENYLRSLPQSNGRDVIYAIIPVTRAEKLLPSLWLSTRSSAI